MEQNRWASATEACNLLLGLLIVSQFPIMFGLLGLSMMYLGGIQAGGLIGGIGLSILGIWLVYTGVGGVVNKAVGKQIFHFHYHK